MRDFTIITAPGVSSYASIPMDSVPVIANMSAVVTLPNGSTVNLDSSHFSYDSGILKMVIPSTVSIAANDGMTYVVNQATDGVAGGKIYVSSPPPTQVQSAPASHAALPVYPLSAYGAFSASGPLETFITESSVASTAFARVFVPAGQQISSVGTFVPTGGTLGAGGDNCFAVYEEDGTLAGRTAADNTIWTTNAKWQFRSLNSPIAAQSVDRFVYVTALIVGLSPMPNLLYFKSVTYTGFLRGGNGTDKRRSFYQGSVTSPPASINPATYGTDNSYVPLYLLA